MPIYLDNSATTRPTVSFIHYYWNLMTRKQKKLFLHIIVINWKQIFKQKFIRIWDVNIH